MASPGAKDVQFGHWIPAHALSFAGFRFGPGVKFRNSNNGFNKNLPDTPSRGCKPVQRVQVEESTRHKLVKHMKYNIFKPNNFTYRNTLLQHNKSF